MAARHEFVKRYGRDDQAHVTMYAVHEREFVIQSTELAYSVFIKGWHEANALFSGLVSIVKDK